MKLIDPTLQNPESCVRLIRIILAVFDYDSKGLLFELIAARDSRMLMVMIEIQGPMLCPLDTSMSLGRNERNAVCSRR